MRQIQAGTKEVEYLSGEVRCGALDPNTICGGPALHVEHGVPHMVAQIAWAKQVNWDTGYVERTPIAIKGPIFIPVVRPEWGISPKFGHVADVPKEVFLEAMRTRGWL